MNNKISDNGTRREHEELPNKSVKQPDEVLLRALDITKRLTSPAGSWTLFEGVNLSMQHQDTIAIVGPSGSGKSSLLHVLAGLDRCDQGDVRLRGVSLFEGPKQNILRKELGFVHQQHHLLDAFTAMEQVAMPLLIQRAPKKEAYARAAELLNRVGLSHRLQHIPGHLSGGERQRVAIARALIGSPLCVMADEPTGSLDPDTAHQTFDLMRRLIEEARSSLIMVTHDHGLAKECDTQMQLKNASLRLLRTEISLNTMN